MRISLHVDSATTDQVRALAVAMHRIGRTGELQVGCDGPNHWSATTPKLGPDEWQGMLGYMAEVGK